MPVCFLNSSTSNPDLVVEVSSPPSFVLPLVAFIAKDAVAEFEDRDVVYAAEVKYEDLPSPPLFEAISKSGCRRFVDDTENVETGDLLQHVFRSLTLAVVKVSRNRDNGLGYAAQGEPVFLQFLKDHS